VELKNLTFENELRRKRDSNVKFAPLASLTNGCFAFFVERVFCPKPGGHFWETCLAHQTEKADTTFGQM
jgi:hypothetical protein